MMFKRAILIVVVISLSYAHTLSSPTQNEGFQRYVLGSLLPQTSSYFRLNATVKPIHYFLRMRPIIDGGYTSLPPRFTVPSSVTILVESISNKSCNSITLHQRNLTIDLSSTRVTYLKTGVNFTVINQTFEHERDLFTIHLGESYELGDNLEVYIKFSTNLSQTDQTGIYLGHYVDPETNRKHYLAATKLEPTHARKVFPLFDEPGMKARFTVSVARVDEKYHSLSNMEILWTEKDTDHEGWVWDHYQESVLMSPYLVCVIVSDFESETRKLDNVERSLSTWAPPHDIRAGGGVYGSITGTKLLDFYEKRFKMEYPLNKLDAVALPQFGSGAMENFGLVTYLHAYLVWIPGENTEAERRKVTQVLAHEITHQWFGNSVTCGWWSDLWLNEGFARYLQFWGMNETIPEFLVEEAFVNDAVQLAMFFDEGDATHPVRNLAASPTEIVGIFDRISYEKAASLMRMMEGAIGRGVLEFGLVEIYLKNMQWKLAYQEDLFRSLQESLVVHNSTHLIPDGVTVQDIMTEWTYTTGFPVVRVTAVDQHTISLVQEKFSLESKMVGAPGHWWVPVKIVTPSSSKSNYPDIWIPNNVSSLTYSRDSIDTGKLVMVNPDGVGYYRVLYDNTLFSLIKSQLEVDHEVISSSSRSQLIDDYFTFMSGGYVQVETPYELTRYLGRESSSNVWVAVLKHLKRDWATFSGDSAALGSLKKYLGSRLEGALGIIGSRQMVDERGINVTLRVQLMELACQFGSALCEGQAAQFMDEWIGNSTVNPFPVDLRPSLYCAAVHKSSDMKAWEFLLAKFHEVKMDAQKKALIKGLSCTTNGTALSYLLEMSVDPSTTLKNFTEQIMTRVAENENGRSIVYEFAKRSFVDKKITDKNFAAAVSALSTYWGRSEQIGELEQFVNDNANDLEKVKSNLNGAITTIQGNIEWLQKFGGRVHAWLRENS